MGHPKPNLQQDQPELKTKAEQHQADEQQIWETPKMEDVSEQVMAQPYIRFT
jgi:hypothetical protein